MPSFNPFIRRCRSLIKEEEDAFVAAAEQYVCAWNSNRGMEGMIMRLSELISRLESGIQRLRPRLERCSLVFCS